MIRLQREKLLQGMQVLCKTSERLKKYKDIESDQLLLLLMDCQELLICIGTELEEHQAQIRDCEEIVKSLEQCCEQVYQLQEASAEERLVRIEELQEMLGSAYKQMEQGMGKERKQIVFFPYKASMWDCMESIWKAADADEACEALVVPIPYYDRTDNGGFGRMHYEGNKLPDYVPILSWEEYDLEEEHPEVVYIHNPYDDANLVTSVHPDYYSKNIRPFTDCLVYVPYYATSGAMGYARESCPAYEHADYIIMQAPKYRKFFDKHIPDSKPAYHS